MIQIIQTHIYNIYVYIYIHIHTYTHICTHTYIYIQTYTHIYTQIFIYIDTNCECLLYQCHTYIKKSWRHFLKISNISILTNLQRTVTNKKCKKVLYIYTN